MFFYKIVAKALQIRLQKLLKEVISPEQLAFLPSQHILSNILLQYKTIEWAKESSQDLIFLKLDFTKVYDMVSWDFLFQVMSKMGIPNSFSHLMMMLSRDAAATIMLNKNSTPSFSIQHASCKSARVSIGTLPFSPSRRSTQYGNNLWTIYEQQMGRIHGIKLPESELKQLLSQYVDDTGLSIRSQEIDLSNILALLQRFELASGLVMKWTQSVGYCFSMSPAFSWVYQSGLT